MAAVTLTLAVAVFPSESATETAAGRELGEVLEIAEGGGARLVPMPAFRAMAATSDAAPIEGGELQFSAQVEVVYALR